MNPDIEALDLLLRASELMERRGETAIVAHIAMPIALLSDRIRGGAEPPHTVCVAD